MALAETLADVDVVVDALVARHAYVEFMSIDACKKVFDAAKEELAKNDDTCRYKIGDNKLSVVLYSRNVVMDVAKGT